MSRASLRNLRYYQLDPRHGPGIPPLPRFIQMEDRDDGKQWLLTYSLTVPETDGFGNISITDEFPTLGYDFYEYGPYAGPYLFKEPDLIRLLIRGGRLGFEVIDKPAGLKTVSNARIMARSGVKRSLREVIVPTTWVRYDPTPRSAGFDVLGWTVVELT